MDRAGRGGLLGSTRESLPALIIAATGFFTILAGGVLHLHTVPRFAYAIQEQRESHQRAGMPTPWWPSFVLAVSDFVGDHLLISLLVTGAVFLALALLARRLGWIWGMALAGLTVAVFLVAYPVLVVRALFPGPFATV